MNMQRDIVMLWVFIVLIWISLFGISLGINKISNKIKSLEKQILQVNKISFQYTDYKTSPPGDRRRHILINGKEWDAYLEDISRVTSGTGFDSIFSGRE